MKNTNHQLETDMEIVKLIDREFIDNLNKERNDGLTTNKNVPVMRKYNIFIDMMKSLDPGLSNEIIINAALECYYDKIIDDVKDGLNL